MFIKYVRFGLLSLSLVDPLWFHTVLNPPMMLTQSFEISFPHFPPPPHKPSQDFSQEVSHWGLHCIITSNTVSASKNWSRILLDPGACWLDLSGHHSNTSEIHLSYHPCILFYGGTVKYEHVSIMDCYRFTLPWSAGWSIWSMSMTCSGVWPHAVYVSLPPLPAPQPCSAHGTQL